MARIVKKRSLSELKKTERARRVLAAREERCERPLRQDIERALIIMRMGVQDRSSFNVDSVMHILRQAKQRKVGEFAWGNRPTRNDEGYTEFEENIYAAKRRDGSIAWDVCRADQDPFGGDAAPCSPLANWNWQDGARAQQRAVVAWAEHEADGGTAFRCRCTDEEMVALDELIPTGDPAADRLAVECRKGGGILEGSLKRRRRKAR